MSVFLKRNDKGDVISFTCEDEIGSVVDLTGATVKFNMGKKNKLITSGAAVITSAVGGVVQYTLTDSDTLVSGNFPAEFEVTFANGNRKTFPTIGYLMVNIEANLDLGKTSQIQDQIALRVYEIDNKFSQLQDALSIGSTYVVDGGSFLDSYTPNVGDIDGGSF